MNTFIGGHLRVSEVKKGKATQEELRIIEENLSKSAEEVQEILGNRTLTFVVRQMELLKNKNASVKSQPVQPGLKPKPNTAPPTIRSRSGAAIGAIMTPSASEHMDDFSNKNKPMKNAKYQDCITKIHADQ